jgi:ATP-binding cassette subfamily B protein
LTVLLSVVQSVVVVPIALIVRLIFDEAIPKKDIPRLITMCLIILAFYILSGGLTLWTRFLSLDTTKKAIQRLRDEMVKKIYSLPRSFFSQTDRMELHTRVVQDTLRVDIMSNALVALFLPSLLISIGLMAILIYLNVILFLILIVIVPLLFIFNKLMGRQLKKKVNSYHRFFEVFSKRISLILEAMDLTRIQSWEKQEMAEQKNVHENLRERSCSQAWFNAAYQVIQKTTIVSMGSLILATGGIFIIKTKITLGELVSFFATLGLLRNYLITLSGTIPGIVEGHESLKALHEIMTMPAGLPYQGKQKIRFRGEIAFQGVDFSFDSRQVLNNISFTLPSHRVTCLQGPNGAGKTTIANLILGFYRPERGQILADGRPYDQLDLVHLRRFFGVVQQDPIVFPGTLYENITYGHSRITKEKLQQVLKWTLCEEFIEKQPQGLSTPITVKGHLLSGGEIQRLSLARALLGDHKLLILDEPSNHLDRDVIRNIVMNIKKMMPCPTLLMISLDQNVARLADSIVVLKNGHINPKKNTQKD